MIFCIMLVSWIDYETWAKTEKPLLDAESRDVVEIGLLFQFALAIIVCGFGLLFEWLHKDSDITVSSR